VFQGLQALLLCGGLHTLLDWPQQVRLQQAPCDAKPSPFEIQKELHGKFGSL
jgi:hypothetical protein